MSIVDERARRYQDWRMASLRGEILLILSAIPGEQSSATGLHAMIGDEATRAGIVEIEAQMRWLDERGYVVANERAGELVVDIADRGMDLVERRETDRGVLIPRVKR